MVRILDAIRGSRRFQIELTPEDLLLPEAHHQPVRSPVREAGVTIKATLDEAVRRAEDLTNRIAEMTRERDEWRRVAAACVKASTALGQGEELPSPSGDDRETL